MASDTGLQFIEDASFGVTNYANVIAFHLAPDNREDIVAADVKVTNANTYALAGIAVQALNDRMKSLEEHRKSLTKPLDEAKRGIMDLFAPAIDDRQRYINVVKKRMLDWQAADRQRRLDEERIAREQQAAEAARLRAEQEAAEAAGDMDKAVELNFQATVAALPVSAPQAVKVSGISTRATWSAEVTDFVALLRAAAENPQAYAQYVQPNTVALGSAIRSQKEAFNVPGVMARRGASLAAGRR